MKDFNVVMAGVGGQGTLLAAEALGIAAVKDDLNVRVNEIHGMAQRGGTVISTVRIGSGVLASTVPEGQADILLGFEPLETLRSLRYVSEKTLVLMNIERIVPSELTAKKLKYPEIEEITKKIHAFTEKIQLVDALELAKKAGSSLTRNIVLLGALAGTKMLPVKVESLKSAVEELVPKRHVDLNLKSFELGYEVMRKAKL